VDILSLILYDKTIDVGKKCIPTPPTRPPNKYFHLARSTIDCGSKMCFDGFVVYHIVPQLNSIDKAKPVVKQGRKATGFYETAGLPNEIARLFYEIMDEPRWRLAWVVKGGHLQTRAKKRRELFPG
jgi:hypothetical protein